MWPAMTTSRGELITVPSRLDERFGRCPLTAVIAPAGFGKTRLLRSWWRRAGETPKALISFDAFHWSNALDAGRAMVRGLREAGVAPAVADELTALLPPDGRSFGAELVRAVEDALWSLDGELVLFFDDVHGLGPEAAGDLGRLVSMVADERHRVVVASRHEPPWPVHRWQVAGFADVLTADDLRLGPDEVAEVLGPELAALVPRVAAATGGWPAALEAVRWRLQVDPSVDVEEAVLDVVDYVGHEVLPLLDPAAVRVLVRTAVLEPFPIDVATAVAGETATPRVLADAARRTSLVVRLDDGRFAYNPVLREALRRRLTELEPGTERELHARAADAWLDEPDSFAGLTSAIHHLIEAHRWERAVALLRRRWAEIDLQARLDLFVHWLAAIPGRWWRDDVEMMLLNSWANLRIGRSAPALEGLQDPTITRHAPAAAIAKVAYASTTAWSTAPLEAVALVDEARPVLAGLDDDRLRDIPAYPGVANFVLAGEVATAQALTFVGRFDDAAAGFERALHRRAELAPMTQVAVLGASAFLLAMRGEASAAERRAGEARRLVADAGMADHVRVSPALVGLAVAAAMTGDRTTAMARLAEAARHCRVVRAANLLRMCDLAGVMCGVGASYLDDVEPPLTPSPLPFVDQFVVAASARRRGRLGDVDGADAELRTTTPHELTLSAWVEVLLARRDRRAVRRWLRAQPPATCDHGTVVRCLVEAATAERGDQVIASAGAAAEAAASGRLVGVLLDAPSQLWSRPEVAHVAHPLLLEAGQRLATDDIDVPTALTPREIDLLHLLPLSLSVNELAERLFVSVNTVKWHRTNLYRKLGVRRRRAAVEAAVERGLLDPPRPAT